MRSLSGVKAPDKEADPIIVHPDVRRMLLTQKVFAEGARMLVYWVANISDKTNQPAGGDADEAEELLSVLTPIAKAFCTETGYEAANLGMQIFGGHGYIKEWGMEQNVRDCRISMLYEGTTGIQALDLLGRKILMKGGEPLKLLTREMARFCQEHEGNQAVAQFIRPLSGLLKSWGDNTMKIGMSAMQNQDEVNAACVDYLMYSGYITYAYLWAKAAVVAKQKLSESNEEFYRNKLYSAQFYFERILPRTAALEQTMLSGVANLSTSEIDPFNI
jgi:3-(methylsulfanyl)propanoyl-CoA dehydrogenase